MENIGLGYFFWRTLERIELSSSLENLLVQEIQRMDVVRIPREETHPSKEAPGKTADVKPQVTSQPTKEPTMQLVAAESPRLRNGSFGSSSSVNKQVEKRLSPFRPHDRKSDS